MGTPGLDIGQFPEYPGHYWHHALSECNSAAKSAGLPCLDGPYADIEDADGFRESAENANMIGCDGKWAIHPSQIEIGNEVFAPDPETAERAKRIVDAYAEAMEEGKGAERRRPDGRRSDQQDGPGHRRDRRGRRDPLTPRPTSTRTLPTHRLFRVERVPERQ